MRPADQLRTFTEMRSMDDPPLGQQHLPGPGAGNSAVLRDVLRARGRWLLGHRVAAWVIWAAALLNMVRAWRYVFGSTSTMGDFQVYLDGARWLWSGRGLYAFQTDSGLGFTYPPFAAVVFTPLASLPDLVAQRTWTALNLATIAALAVTIVQAWWADRPLTTRIRAAGLVCLVLTESILVRANLLFGQISLLLILLSALETGRVLRGPRWGALTGLAAAVKLTPALFGVQHLLNDRRRFWWSFGFGVGATVLAAAILPRESWTYWTSALWDTKRIGDVGSPGNVGWMGMLANLGVSGVTRSILGAVLMASTVAVALWNGRRHWRSAPLASAAIVGCASVLVAPISWPHHAAWLLVWSAGAVLGGGRAQRALGLLWIGLGLVWVPFANACAAIGLPMIPYATLVAGLALATVLPCQPRSRTPRS